MKRYNFVLLCAAGSHTIALFVLSNLPTARVPAALRMGGCDKILHAAAFAVLTVLLLEGAAAKGSARRILLVAAIVLGIGALIELTQPFFGRACLFSDWLADVVGFLAALAGWATARSLAAGRKRKAVAVPAGDAGA